LSYVKKTTLTIRLDEDLEGMLAQASRRLRRTRSEVAREALRRHLLLLQFGAVMPFAEARGLLTDEDVFDRIS
jgi:predicted transcriptional regulator